jgi:hypothetical protein
VIDLHAAATIHRAQLAAAAGVSPHKLPTGTLRALLLACGWRLERAGRVKSRGGERDALTYRSERLALPEGVEAQALAAVWLAELQAPAGTAPTGALFAPIENLCRAEKCPMPTTGAPPPPRAWPLAPPVLIPWAAAPPRSGNRARGFAHSA